MAGERPPGAKPDAAPAGAGAAKPAKAGGALGAWLPLILTVAIMPVLAYGMTSFVILPKLQKSLGLTSTQPEAGATEGGHGEAAGAGGGHSGGAGGADAGEAVALSKVLVNVNGTMGSRYLLSSYSISGKGADFAAKFEKNKPKLLDLAGGILAAKSISDLEKPTIRNLIRSELITAFNTVLGNNAVQEINITEFAIQ